MTNKSEKAVTAMTFFEFERKFPDEKAAIDYFLEKRYKGSLVCPHCGTAVNIYRYRDRPKFFQCYKCNNTFSPFRETVFKKTHIDMRRWFYAIKLFLNSRKGISGCRLERELGVTYKTAWRMLQQIRKAMGNDGFEGQFEFLVEVDETYVGGKPRKPNTRLDKNKNPNNNRKPKNKRGRGTNKIPVIGAKERHSTKVYVKAMLPNKKGQKLTQKQVYGFIKKICKEGTVVATDDLSSYKILDKKKQQEIYGHVTVCHSKGEYYAGNGVHTNGIENFWSVLKRGIIGIYHHITGKYLQMYLDEFVFRQNTRLDRNMFDVLLGQCVLA